MDKIIGNCSKHPGHNFVNCPLCEIERQKKLSKNFWDNVQKDVERVNPTPEGVTAEAVSNGEKLYAKGLTQNLGKTQPYHYSGHKCVPGCKNFTAYETKHHKDCPYYPGSLSEKYDIVSSSKDEEIARLKRIIWELYDGKEYTDDRDEFKTEHKL